MAREFAKKFYASTAWKKCRASYISKVHGLCERCQQPGYIVHHKKRITPKNIQDVSVTLNHENLEFLCLNCHNEEHMPSNLTVKGLKFDESGNLVPCEAYPRG